MNESAFSEILKELEKMPLAWNRYRTEAGEGRSQAFGVVNRRSLPTDYSRWCWKRPYLYKLLLEFAEKYVNIPWNAITVNDNYRASKHRDKGNVGRSFLVAFGDYTGGGLRIYEGDLEGVHDIRHTPIVADFSKIYHSVEPFEGKRYSLVFYTLDTGRRGKVVLPPPSVVFHEGMWVFKRGEELVINGLPHPRSKKMPLTFAKEEAEVKIEFS